MLISSIDSEWAFALFLSKVTIIHEYVYQTKLFNQLPNPSAKNFTPDILKKAMLETISSLNIFAEEAHISEVSVVVFLIPGFQFADISLAKFNELLCHRRGECSGDTIHIFTH